MRHVGDDINTADENGRTPLHHVCAAGSSHDGHDEVIMKIAAMLLTAGAEPHTLDADGYSPLGLACLNARTAVLKRFATEGVARFDGRVAEALFGWDGDASMDLVYLRCIRADGTAEAITTAAGQVHNYLTTPPPVDPCVAKLITSSRLCPAAAPFGTNAELDRDLFLAAAYSGHVPFFTRYEAEFKKLSTQHKRDVLDEIIKQNCTALIKLCVPKYFKPHDALVNGQSVLQRALFYGHPQAVGSVLRMCVRLDGLSEHGLLSDLLKYDKRLFAQALGSGANPFQPNIVLEAASRNDSTISAVLAAQDATVLASLLPALEDGVGSSVHAHIKQRIMCIFHNNKSLSILRTWLKPKLPDKLGVFDKMVEEVNKKRRATAAPADGRRPKRRKPS